MRLIAACGGLWRLTAACGYIVSKKLVSVNAASGGCWRLAAAFGEGFSRSYHVWCTHFTFAPFGWSETILARLYASLGRESLFALRGCYLSLPALKNGSACNPTCGKIKIFW
ncbi:hypothetical protein [Nostoc flagelliforme]|uniref:hypothetical protein n=1 Tax=Nostoc flagelliforme TaxID=1306274 RepID=UPI0012FD7C46|nr:hypothetical protein [Nostoc flagelliforme]